MPASEPPTALPDEPADAGSRWYFPRTPAPAAGPSAVPDPALLAQQISEAAIELGFARVAFAPAEPFVRGGRALASWLGHGFAGEMSYLAEGDRADPRQLLAAAKSVVAVAMGYPGSRPELVSLGGPAGKPLRGTIARYARGDDYHSVLKDRLHSLAERTAELVGRPLLARPCVDTAPLLEREAAARAGLGFLAKNTLAIVPGLGSYVLLGELLLDVEVAPGAPLEPRCGSCRACLDACPTQAFVSEHVLDARRCISYLTIEHSGVIPRDLRRPIGQHIFGCDVCQEVCPYNASPNPRPAPAELEPRPERDSVDLVSVLELGSAGYRKFVKRSALKRAKRATLARNAAIALGNSRDPAAEGPLCKALASHPSAIVRGHAAWALGELSAVSPEAESELLRAAELDADAFVRDEARQALETRRASD